MQFTRHGVLPKPQPTAWERLLELAGVSSVEDEEEPEVIVWIDPPELDVDGHVFVSRY
jgi:hypothetical protein